MVPMYGMVLGLPMATHIYLSTTYFFSTLNLFVTAVHVASFSLKLLES
jgi:hypothetical protein